QVSLVARDQRESEVLRRRRYQGWQLLYVGSVLVQDFDAGNDVRFHTSDDVTLHPFLPKGVSPVFVVVPPLESGGTETRRIYSEIGFHALKRKTGFRNQVGKHGRQFRLLQILEDRVVVRRTVDKSTLPRLAEIAHEPPTGKCRVDLEGCTEHGVGQRQPWPSLLLRRLNDAITQVAQ